MKRGIDVSAHNVIDWNLAKNNNVEFAIIRAGYGYGNGEDKSLSYNVKECERLGIPYGFYWASYAACDEDAYKEAVQCYGEIKNFNPTYPVYFDWEDFSFEYAKGQGLTDRKKGANFAKVFCEDMESKGYFAGVYTNYNYYKNVFGEELFKRFSLWLAYWNIVDVPVKAPMWQYKVENAPFASGRVDFNYCYYDFPAIIESMKEPEQPACRCDKCPYKLEEN